MVKSFKVQCFAYTYLKKRIKLQVRAKKITIFKKLIYFSSLVVCSLSYQIKQPNMTIFQYDLTEKSNQHMIKYFYKY